MSATARVIATLQAIGAEYAPAAFANSLGAEDMVLTDLIARYVPGIEMFTLDTGRLHEETHRLMQRLGERYAVPLRIYVPEHAALEAHVARYGANAFYRSVEQRKACCAVRKLEPLGRALSGKRAWITGLRRGQSQTRGDLAESEWDAAHRMTKFNPLWNWSEQDVWEYIRANDVPYNELHDRGFSSIGCAPCTRAIAAGEDVRAGRWWWEDAATKECGLHPIHLVTAARAQA